MMRSRTAASRPGGTIPITRAMLLAVCGLPEFLYSAWPLK